MCLTSVCNILRKGQGRTTKSHKQQQTGFPHQTLPSSPSMDNVITSLVYFLFSPFILISLQDSVKHSAAKSGHQGILYNHNKKMKTFKNTYMFISATSLGSPSLKLTPLQPQRCNIDLCSLRLRNGASFFLVHIFLKHTVQFLEGWDSKFW